VEFERGSAVPVVGADAVGFEPFVLGGTEAAGRSAAVAGPVRHRRESTDLARDRRSPSAIGSLGVRGLSTLAAAVRLAAFRPDRLKTAYSNRPNFVRKRTNPSARPTYDGRTLPVSATPLSLRAWGGASVAFTVSAGKYRLAHTCRRLTSRPMQELWDSSSPDGEDPGRSGDKFEVWAWLIVALLVGLVMVSAIVGSTHTH
jgi:hypothetical protein